MKYSVSRVTLARGLKQGGFTLVETLVVLGLALVMMAAGTQYVVRHTENIANDAASDHLKSVSAAASKYVQDNEDAIRAALSSAPTASVSIPMLKAQGYLPASMSETNNFGQQYTIRFVMSPNDTIEGLVVTQGGERIKALNKRKIAQSVGAAGGHLNEESLVSLSGAYGSWSRPLADFGVPAGEAELAYALFVDDAIKEGGVTDHYMSRKEVAGSPELNQMLVDLDMAGNDLNNVGVVNAESAVIATLQAGDLTTDKLHVKEGATFDGRASFRHSNGMGPLVERTNSSSNSTIEYKTTGGSVFAGAASGDTFAIGGAANVSAAANRWFEVSASGAKVGGADVWTTDTFDPDTKAEKEHLHDANQVTTGVLADARIPSLNASKISSGVLAVDRIPNLDASKMTTGVFNAARIPSLDASKVSTGVFNLARIPALPISKITGLQGVLDDKLSLSGGTLRGSLSIDGGNRPLSFYAQGARHSYMQWFVEPTSSTRSAYVGFGSSNSTYFSISNEKAGGDISLRPGDGGAVKVNDSPVWHSSNFDPASKADVDHRHSASDITSGTLAPARIPDLDAAKIATGVLSANRIPNLSASKITAGTFTSARIPNLDASKITSGTFEVARIPTLPISKISGLQAALDDKAPINSPRFTSGLAINNGYFDLYSYSSTYGSGRMQSYYDANNATWNLRGRNSAGTAVDMTLNVHGAVTVKGNEVWHRGSFNPDAKADVNHTHSAANITSGTLHANRIPTLAISKVSGLQDALDETVKTSGNQAVAGIKTFTSEIRTTGNTGWRNNTHGGGWYMSDSTWIRAYNNKSVVTTGTMQAGTIRSTGDTEVGQDLKATRDVFGRYIRPQQTATCNASCSTNGLIARTSSGAALSCESGKWKGYSCGSGGGGGTTPPPIIGCDCSIYGPGWETQGGGCWKPGTGELRQCY